jgi:hypothetical protein
MVRDVSRTGDGGERRGTCEMRGRFGCLYVGLAAVAMSVVRLLRLSDVED